MLADMKLKIETARLAVYQAAWKMAQPDVKSYSVDAAIAKKYASDVAMQVTTDAVQVFGGYGFTREYPVERCAMLRSLRFTKAPTRYSRWSFPALSDKPAHRLSS